MADIDFDELDRAVSSLMNEATQGDESSDDSSSALDVSEQQATTDVNKSSNSSVQPASISSTTKRFSGRFMDVVPPSSVRHSQPSRVASRVGAKIEPLPSPDEPQASESSTDDSPNSTISDNNLEHQLIDQAENSEVSQSNQSEPEVDGNDDESTKPVSTDPIAPLESPFLSGATVNKRPLGAPGAVSEQVSHPEPEEPVPAEDSWGSVDSNDQLVPETFVPEYGKEVMALESQELATGELVVDNQPVSPDEPIVDTSEPTDIAVDPLPTTDTDPNVIDNETPASSSSVSVPEQVGVPAGGDIPQQWAPVDDSAEPAPMFDAVADQAQQLSPVKKKSGWSVFLIIIAFLLIGIGGGVAVYYFLLQ